jgi:CheY-like chemotaxis protein
MPEVDGYEGCKRIKSRRAGQLPVAMLTSKSLPSHSRKDAAAYLTKPVEPAQRTTYWLNTSVWS